MKKLSKFLKGQKTNISIQCESVEIKKDTFQKSLKTSFIFIVVFLFVISGVALMVHGNGVNATNHVKITNNTFSPNTKAVSDNAFQVNPSKNYQSEPAPMGIADYGIGPNNNAYSYNTTSFLGIVKTAELSVTNSTDNSPNLTFQLNVNLEFQNSGTTYVYWVQDVAFVNSATDTVYFIDNIWNMSSVNANVYNSTLSGNGTTYPVGAVLFYYDYASSSLPGTYVNLKTPSTIELRVNSTVNVAGLPEVTFQYQDGFGWQTYDNVNFTFAKSVSNDKGFVVDGSSYEPSGGFYDSELILGGPGGGASATDVSSNVSLELQYWNGNNFQEISNAFNYGSNTGENINNVISNAYYYNSNGSLYENITNGKGTLGQVYNSNQVSSLSLSAPIDGGTVSINGTMTSFKGDGFNMTLSPGSYSVKVYSNSALYYSTDVVLQGGQNLLLRSNEYLVTFNQTGLPVGSQWWVNLTQGSYTSKSGSLSFYVANGTYNFNISRLNLNYRPNLTEGSFTVTGSNVNISIGFPEVLYNVTFRESSLPADTNWSILFNKATFNSINGTVTIQVTNGSYNFTANNLLNYYVDNNTFLINVDGSNVSEQVLFHRYAIISGTVNPSTSELTINGNQIAISNGTFSYNAVAGNYTIVVKESGYYEYVNNVTVVPGQNVSLSINLTKIPVPQSKIPGYEALGVLAAVLAIAGVGAVVVKRR